MKDLEQVKRDLSAMAKELTRRARTNRMLRSVRHGGMADAQLECARELRAYLARLSEPESEEP